jgi:glycosyltransferase involved in cell wall biosynthesis
LKKSWWRVTLVEVKQVDSLPNPLIPNKSSLVVVAGIPAYNEEKTIARVVLEAQKHVHIVIICDDGSADLTSVIASRLGALVVRHEKNMGYGAALQSLFKRAKELQADVLVTLDSDGQHDPSEIPRLVTPIHDRRAEVVLGSRFIDKSGTDDMPVYRQFGVKVITKLSNGSGKNVVSDSQSGFRAYSKVAIETLSGISENGMSASIELIRAINKSGLKVCEVPITCKYGDSVGVATSTEHPISQGVGLIMSIVKLVVEDRPLVYLGLPGIFCLISGAFFGVWMLQVYALKGLIETNIALAAIAFILIGFFALSTSITLYAITRIRRGNK